VGRGTVANVLKREGIEPAPERGVRTPWSMFLKAHWRSIVAADFFTAQVWFLHGLVTYFTCCSSLNWPSAWFTLLESQRSPTRPG